MKIEGEVRYMYGPGGCSFAGFGSGMMFPFGWLGIVLVIIGAYMFYRIVMDKRNSTSNVQDILDMKYATGEIDEETYLRKKSIVSSKKKV
jgi:uncharacterized membrane protein